MVDETIINIEEVLGNSTPQYISIDKLITGVIQARQTGTKVEKDDKLVLQIRKTGGLLNPIIVRDLKNGTYEIIVGQRRTGAYHILKEEDPKYEKIRAYVIDKDLSDDEIRVISFTENFARDDMSRLDYINVIEYFYTKYNMNKKMTAEALGISIGSVTAYLTHSRLSDKVKECISNKEFTIDVALKALKGLGDDENSVDENILIETAKALAEVKPPVRKKAIKKMQTEKIPAREAIKVTVATKTIPIEITYDQLEMLESYKEKHECENQEEAAVEAMDAELVRDTKH